MSRKINRSLSQWVKNSKRLEGLVSDKEQNLARIKEYGLPSLDFFIPENISDIKQFLKKYKSIVIRATPLDNRNIRKYRLDVRSFEDYLSFLKDINPDNYKIILSEYVSCEYAGAIISNPPRIVIELLKGTHDELIHGSSTPFTNFVDFTGKMIYNEKMSEKEKNLVWKTLKTIKISKGDYLKGYFEFLITKQDKPKFIDYNIRKIYYETLDYK
ncbi:hypothetical protein KY332_04880 [Candidatus Woesearchaeota archaeon]|nr:hypothetical protein [Candidatus Woesearchaeota archaeon]